MATFNPSPDARVRPHRKNDSDRPSGQRCEDLARVRVRNQSPEEYLSGSYSDAGNERGQVVPAGDVLLLDAEEEYRGEC